MSFSAEVRRAAAPVWEAQHAHPFVRGIADGSLPEARFRAYVRQDYVFLVDYGRLLALAAARAPRLAWMRRLAGLAQSVLEDEMSLHRELAASWGLAVSQLDAERPWPATAAYCDFLLRTAALGDFGQLAAALLPCMWGYAELGGRLAAAGGSPHPGYAAWVQTYAGDEFAELAAWSREVVDEAAREVAGEGRARMQSAFLASSEHELAFWDAAWAAG